VSTGTENMWIIINDGMCHGKKNLEKKIVLGKNMFVCVRGYLVCVCTCIVLCVCVCVCVHGHEYVFVLKQGAWIACIHALCVCVCVYIHVYGLS
jgi:hypothetical protein